MRHASSSRYWKLMLITRVKDGAPDPTAKLRKCVVIRDYPAIGSFLSGVATIMPKLNATRRKAQKAHTKKENQTATNQYESGLAASMAGDAIRSGNDDTVSAKPPKHALRVKPINCS